MRELIAPRARRLHKGDYGHVLVVAGSRGQDRRGAPGGDRRAAVGRRAGHRRHAARRASRSSRRMAPEYMTEPLDEDADGPSTPAPSIACSSSARDVIAIGPGLGQAPGTRAFVQALVERAGVPLVLDADALERVRRRSGPAGGPRRARRHHHAASGRDGAAGRHVDRRSAGEPPRGRARLRRRASRLRRPEGAPHADRDAGREGRSSTRPAIPGWPPAAPATC